MKIADIQDIFRFYQQLEIKRSTSFDLGALHMSSSKMSAFFRAISEPNTVATDHDIYAKIYGKGNPDAKYHFLKSQSTSFLLEQFLREHIDQRIDSGLTRGAYMAQKQYVIATLLSRLGRKTASRILTAKALRMCQRYQLTTLSIDLLEELRHYAFLEGQTRLFEKYSKEIEQAVDMLRAELEMKRLDQSIRVQLSKAFLVSDALRNRLIEIARRAEAIAFTHKHNYAIQVAFYRIKYMASQAQGNLPSSISACEDAISYIRRQSTFTSKSRTGEFAVYLLENHLLGDDRAGGMQSVELCEDIIAKGSNLWFKFKEYHLLFAIHTDQIEMGLAVLDEVRSHPRFIVQIDHLKERWNIFKLVLDYRQWIIQKSATSKPIPSLLRYKKYREMLRSYPVYIKDKRGFNVSLLIMNILVLLESGREDEIVEQIEALATYRNKYLKGKEVGQSAVLFKFFKTMVTCNFSYEKTLHRTRAFGDLLLSSGKTTSEVTGGLQILPCAWVFDRVLLLLKKKDEAKLLKLS